jgi:heterotetrameric sarcosine oxidase delta subunit
MILLPCPNCGPRNVSEYRFGGEVTNRPAPEQTTPATWAAYLYMRQNVLGVQREWWYHSACGCWFVAERHTKTQDIQSTYFWSPEKSSP